MYSRCNGPDASQAASALKLQEFHSRALDELGLLVPAQGDDMRLKIDYQ
jgi:hypothetical protein